GRPRLTRLLRPLPCLFFFSLFPLKVSPPPSPVLARHFADDRLRSRLYHSPLIAGMLPNKRRLRLSYSLYELLAPQYRTLTLGFIILLQRFLVTRKHELMKRFSPPGSVLRPLR